MAKVKVSQATIDKIKKQGMAKSLAGASSANPEMREALRRMYGQARLDKAMGTTAKSTAPRFKSPDAAKAANKPARFKSADSARASVAKKAAAPKQKTRPTFGGFSMLANTLVGGATQKGTSRKTTKKTK